MRYIEVIIDTPAQLIDSRCEELAALGAEGFVIENEDDFKDFLDNNQQYWDYVDDRLEEAYSGVSRIKLYLMDDAGGEAILAAILAAFPEAKHGYTADQDWENSWRDYYEPIEVGDKLIVVPEWMDAPESDRHLLRLDPGIAFGTGSHPTTRLSLAALEPYAKEGIRVLDLGCGSGILGIGALILGADKALGCDIDPMASEAAMANAALNGIGKDRFDIYIGDIIKDASLRRSLGSGYQLVLANIVADVIIALSPLAGSFMAEDGIFICSGIIDSRCEEVWQKLSENGFDIISHTQEEEWHCFVCRER
ncbi:MAG: 50S ribosomal protein L11 methyltransferase [Oscillospiraceae bacterium]|nr:50S ribosomal protein L11 methyltransferase [Oscillospiraceae bacterium]